MGGGRRGPCRKRCQWSLKSSRHLVKSVYVYVFVHIFQDTKIEDIPPIILQANFYLILGLAPQQKPNQIEDIL